jgi:HEAT repeat protein
LRALYAIEYVRDPRLVGPMRQLLRDPDAGVRSAAARALGYLADRRATLDAQQSKRSGSATE